jgi:hypothetical protein
MTKQSMTILPFLTLCLSVASGCAEPPELPTQPVQPSAEQPQQPDAQPQLPEGQPQVVEGGEGPHQSLFTKLIEEADGASITISGTVRGAATGQLDFTAIQEIDGMKQPVLLHVERFENGTFSVKAPAEYDHPVVVMAMEMEEGSHPDQDTPSGGYKTPIKLEGQDLQLAITIGEHNDPGAFFPPPEGLDPATKPDWMKETTPEAGADAPPPEPAAEPPTPDAAPEAPAE